jgi:tripartite-type tricarboxylate transporter receptor subunit TctC
MIRRKYAMIQRSHSRLFVGMAVATSILCVSPAPAEDWPTHPLTLVYPFAAGSAGDVPGRLLASRLSELLGQPVIFENVGGAGGMAGAARIARLGLTATRSCSAVPARMP